MTAEDAVRWVDENRGLIVLRAKKLLPFSPYGRKDFVQDAYEAAIMAARVAKKKDIPFKGCFWTIFNRLTGNVVPNPLSPRHSGSTSPPSTVCDGMERMSSVLCATEDEKPWHDVDRLYLAVCEYLSETEKKVWRRALGITDKGRMSTYEIAEELGCSAANVRETIRRVVDRLSRKKRDGVLHIPKEAVAVRRLTVVNGKPCFSSCSPKLAHRSTFRMAEAG